MTDLRRATQASVADSESAVVSELRRIIAAAREENVTAQELVIDAVRNAILSGVLAPEARLRQEELAELFGTSRIPVREALRALEYEGLVQSEPHRGFTVTAIDADDVEEVYELRILLESYAIRLSLPLVTEEDLEELEAIYAQMTNAKTPDDALAARERLYIRLYSISGRPRLVGLIVRLRQEVARALRWPTCCSRRHRSTTTSSMRCAPATPSAPSRSFPATIVALPA